MPRIELEGVTRVPRLLQGLDEDKWEHVAKHVSMTGELHKCRQGNLSRKSFVSFGENCSAGVGLVPHSASLVISTETDCPLAFLHVAASPPWIETREVAQVQIPTVRSYPGVALDAPEGYEAFWLSHSMCDTSDRYTMHYVV